MGEHLTEDALDLGALIAATDDMSAGALAIFVGTVRSENLGRRVSGVTYEAHPTLAARALEAIEREALESFAVRRCRIVHRTGFLALGEASVAIIVRSVHRDAAFSALRYAIEEIKTRVPIWKIEYDTDGNAAYLDGISLVVSTENP